MSEKGFVDSLLHRWSQLLEGRLRELAGGASIAFGLRLIGGGFAFLFNLLLARMFGADGVGIYFLALSLGSVAAVAGKLGMDNALLRFTAVHAEKGQWAAVRGLYRGGVTLSLLASGACSALLLLGAPVLATHLFGRPELVGPIRAMALAVVPVVVALLHVELLRGLHRIFESQLLQWGALRGFPVVVLLVMGTRFGVMGAIWAYTCGAAATALIGILLWRRRTHAASLAKPRFPLDKLLGSAIPSFGVGLLGLAMDWSGIIVLGIFESNHVVGVFSAASKTAILSTYVLAAVNVVAAPKFSALYAKGDAEELARTARSVVLLATLLATPFFLALFTIPETILSLFGTEFTVGAPLLVIIAVGQLVNVLTGPVAYLLMMTGHEHDMRRTLAIFAVLNIALNLSLVPPLGALGAAIATSVSLIGINSMATYLVHRRLSISLVPSSWFSFRSMPS